MSSPVWACRGVPFACLLAGVALLPGCVAAPSPASSPSPTPTTVLAATPTAAPVLPSPTSVPTPTPVPPPTAIPTATPTSGPTRLELVVVVDRLATVAGLAVLADGSVLFTERLAGRLRLYRDGKLQEEPVLTFPVAQGAEMGLLGVAAHPSEPWVYVYYTDRPAAGAAQNRVVRFWLVDEGGTAPEVVLDGVPASPIHNGGQVRFGPDGKLYVTTGDAGVPQRAQDLSSPSGKVLRLNPDGSIPSDNPFPGSPVFTYGHRNIFGLAFHPRTGEPYITENGPTQNDEVNHLVAGQNYGWPQVTGRVSDPRLHDPIITFTPNIAPTGATFLVGDRYPAQYRGDLFFGDWNTGSLHRLKLGGPANEDVVAHEVVVRAPGGIVALVQGPDGYLYVATANAIYRLEAR